MSTKFFSATRLVCAALFFLLLAGVSARAAAPDDLNLQAELVTGTNDPHQTNGVPVTVNVARKLSRLPLKWQYYFVINSQQFILTKNEYKEISLSDACQFSVKNIGGEQVQFALMGHGLNVSKIKQSLKKGQTLVAGSNAENSLIVLRQAD